VVFCRIEIARWEIATVYVPASNVIDVTESLKNTDNKTKFGFKPWAKVDIPDPLITSFRKQQTIISGTP
jgi:hypothetical protein